MWFCWSRCKTHRLVGIKITGTLWRIFSPGPSEFENTLVERVYVRGWSNCFSPWWQGKVLPRSQRPHCREWWWLSGGSQTGFQPFRKTQKLSQQIKVAVLAKFLCFFGNYLMLSWVTWWIVGMWFWIQESDKVLFIHATENIMSSV